MASYPSTNDRELNLFKKICENSSEISDMPSTSPSLNDSEYNLIFKIAVSWYQYALDLGHSGFNPPSLNDRKFDLLKRIAYYTARIAS